MNVALLWVRGQQDAADRVLIELGATPEKTWKKGEPKGRDSLHIDAGFSINVAEAKNPREMGDNVREFLTRCQQRSIALQGADYSSELSLGVTVGSQDQFVAVMAFSVDDLSLVGELGVKLTVAAYPSSDDDG
jgi:hypothetical protein